MTDHNCWVIEVCLYPFRCCYGYARNILYCVFLSDDCSPTICPKFNLVCQFILVYIEHKYNEPREGIEVST